MTRPITLTSKQESLILLAQTDLRKLAEVRDILSPTSYNATQRSILRKLVAAAFVAAINSPTDKSLLVPPYVT